MNTEQTFGTPLLVKRVITLVNRKVPGNYSGRVAHVKSAVSKSLAGSRVPGHIFVSHVHINSDSAEDVSGTIETENYLVAVFCETK